MNAKSDIFLRDRLNQTTTIISKGLSGTESNGHSTHVGISGNGRFIVYNTFANNIVSNDNDNFSEVILYDRQSDNSINIEPEYANNLIQEDTQAPTISGDGRYVTYKAILQDTSPGGTQYNWNSILYNSINESGEIISVYEDGSIIAEGIGNTNVSDNGRYVLFDTTDQDVVPYDINGYQMDDVYMVDRSPSANILPHLTIDGATESNNGTETYTFTVYEKNENDTFTIASEFPSCGDNGTLVSGSLNIGSSGGSFQCAFSGGTTSNVQIKVEDSGNLESNLAMKIVSLGSSDPIQATFNPSADTYIRSGQANQNEGAGQFMRIQANGNNRALVRFDQAELESEIGNGTILSATLQLTITDNSNNWGSEGRTVDLHRLISDWIEGNGTENDRGTGNGATWNCAIDSLIQNLVKDCSDSTEWEMAQPNNPSVHPWIETPTDTQTITNNQTGIIEYDVTQDVTQYLDGSTNNYGWLLKKTNEAQAGQAEFGTKESQFTPQLTITYQP
jgi:hypothetical protein